MNTVDYLAFDKTVKEAKNERGSTDHADGLPESQRRAQILQDLSTRAETKGTCSPSQKDCDAAAEEGDSGGGDGELEPERWAVDPVNNPAHYRGKVQCIEAIESAIEGRGPEEAFYMGQCLKYLWRNGKKGNPVQDLEKCQWYLCRFIRLLKDREHGSQDSPKNGRVNCPS